MTRPWSGAGQAGIDQGPKRPCSALVFSFVLLRRAFKDFSCASAGGALYRGAILDNGAVAKAYVALPPSHNHLASFAGNDLCATVGGPWPFRMTVGLVKLSERR